MVKKDGTSEQLNPGDSVLATHGHTFLRPGTEAIEESAQGPAVPGREWQMASVSLLLPKRLDDPSQGAGHLHSQQSLTYISTSIFAMLAQADPDFGL